MPKLRPRRLLLIGFGLALLALLVSAFLPKPVEVDQASVTRGPLLVTVDEDGKTRIKDRYVVAAPLAGQLLRVELRAGDTVEAGKTIMAVIEPTEPELLDDRARLQAEARIKAAEGARQRAVPNLERARSAYALATSELNRARQLGLGRNIAQQDLDAAIHRERAAAEDLKAAQFGSLIADYELELARAALVRTRSRSPGDMESWHLPLRAPISGRVLRVFQESTTVVTPGMRLLEIGDPADLECEIDVLSSDAVKIRPGMRVLLEHWGGARPLAARVRLVEPGGFTKISALGVEEQRVNVILDFAEPNEQWKSLGDGYRVEARIVIWESADVLKVPAGALVRQGADWAVFVVEAGKAQLRSLSIGQNNGLEAEVLAGLKENDIVILHASDKIKSGVSVVERKAVQ